MKIQLKGYLTLNLLVGSRSIDLDQSGSTVRQLLDNLAIELGEDFSALLNYTPEGELDGNLVVLVNGRHGGHLPQGLDTPLQDGDEVSIFPPIAGG